MKFNLFILSLLISFIANADPQAIRIAKYIGTLNMHEVTLSLVDSICLSSNSLSIDQIEEMDKVTREKTGISYKNFIDIIGESEYTHELAEEVIQPILDSDCNRVLMNHWYSNVSMDFNKNLLKLKEEKPTNFFKEPNVKSIINCNDYANMYAESLGEHFDLKKELLISQIVLNDLHKLNAPDKEKIKEDIESLEFEVTVLKDSYAKKAESSDGNTIRNQAYSYCLISYK